jgi:cytochrome c biogenesis protein CcmG, thiol:disulfide interchange protein DsbE
MKRFLLPIGFFAVLIPILIVGLSKDPRALPSTFLGKPAPQFTLPELRDPTRQVSNESFGGQIVLVNFWATWCIGCRQEHGFLMQLAANKVIPIFGINWRDDKNDAINWLQELGDPYVVSAYDGENHTGIDWGVYAAPETFLLDATGTVIFKFLGPLSPSVWEQEFAPRIVAANEAAR